ncbi:MAG: hypothetical protein M4579_006189 [Chaenotheca gracillima]|nr:MAG: hypothetical protein M4579_006189 [Chaenotheca gracillima]
MWEVDPETRSKLAEIQKKEGNSLCCDCGAPAPQWASPKFGVFLCLTCAGTHRGLGVHISFVRSITMDAFKVPEISRMDKGGNSAWKRFFDAHELTKLSGVGWEESTIADRYSGDVGEEWRERLTAKVEGRDYVPVEREKKQPQKRDGATSISGGSAVGSRSGTPLGRNRIGAGSSASSLRSQSPAAGGKKVQNEAYFAKLGSANASRPAELAPSQGGKYAGFGSAPPEGDRPGAGRAGGAMPGVDDFQNDPVAALTKGFGWFTTTVGKSAKSVNEGWIQPTAQRLADGELAARTRMTAAQLGQNLQSSTASASAQFNKFVEGEDAPSRTRGGGPGKEPERKDFWDSFGDGSGAGGAPEERSSIGTSAMRKGGGGGMTGFGGGTAAGTGGAKGKMKGEEGWEEEEW